MDKITQRIKELEDLIQQRKGTKMLTSGEIGCLRNKLKGFKEGVAMERERVKEIIGKWRIQLEDEGFVTIDKRFVNELLQAIDSENKSNTNKEKTE